MTKQREAIPTAPAADSEPRAETKVESKSGFIQGLKDRMGELSGRAGEFFSRHFDTIASKTQEWAGDIFESVKLQTIDKWNLARESWGQNRLIKRKTGDIENLSKKNGKLDGVLTKKQGQKEKHEAEFETALEAITDPTLRSIFEKSRTEKIGKDDEEIQRVVAKQQENSSKQSEYTGDIETYKGKIKTLEQDFVGKIDGRIDKIKQKENYEQNIESSRQFSENITQIEVTISQSEDQIKQYESVLDSKSRKLLGKEGVASVRAKLTELKKTLDATKQELKRAREGKKTCDKRINKTDKRLKSLNNLRQKYTGEQDADSPENAAGTVSGNGPENIPSTESQIEGYKKEFSNAVEVFLNDIETKSEDQLSADLLVLENSIDKLLASDDIGGFDFSLFSICKDFVGQIRNGEETDVDRIRRELTKAKTYIEINK